MGRIQRTSQGFGAITRIIFGLVVHEGRRATSFRCSKTASIVVGFTSISTHVLMHDARRIKYRFYIEESHCDFESKSARYQPFHVHVSKFLVSLCREMNVVFSNRETAILRPFSILLGEGQWRTWRRRDDLAIVTQTFGLRRFILFNSLRTE